MRVTEETPVTRIGEKLLQSIPLLYLISAPLAATIVFLLSLPTHPQVETTYDIVFRFSLYVPFAVAVSVVFVGKIMLCRRSDAPHGLVSLWLTTVTYAWGCFAVTMWGIVSLIVVNTFHLSLFDWSDGSVLRGLSFSFVGIGMIGEVIAAIVIIVGFKYQVLGMLIRPWPLPRVLRRRAK